jgi:hypothetical protein
MDPSQFDIVVREDKRGTIFEGIESGHTDPEGAINLLIRVARDHLVLSVWPLRPQVAQISQRLAQILGPPRESPAVCGFGDCMDDDKDAPLETAMWEFDAEARPEVLSQVRAFLGLAQEA